MIVDLLVPAVNTRQDGALCARWPSDVWGSDDAVERVTAAHLCQVHCPAFDGCREQALSLLNTPLAYRSVVVGGVIFSPGGHPSKGNANPRCESCFPARRSPRGPVRHGTETAVKAHREAGEPKCDECREYVRLRSALRRVQLRQRAVAA